MNTLFLRPIPVQGKIRLGAKRDGGYVVYKRLLEKTEMLMSYGVGLDVSFEEDFNHLTNKRVVMFDPTLFGKYLMNFKRAIGYVFMLRLIPLAEYLRFVAQCSRKLKSLKKRSITFVNEGLSESISGKYYTFLNHIERFAKNEREILLKIDIEESEYDVLFSADFYAGLSNVNQIVIEFHNLKNRLRDLHRIMTTLLRDYYLIHIHGNNCGETFKIYGQDLKDICFPDTIEVTLIRKEKLAQEDRLMDDANYPVNRLDYPNDPEKADYPLQFTV